MAAQASSGPCGSGFGSLVAEARDGRTFVAAARAHSPLRWVMPSFPGAATCAAACVVTFGGGLVDGDSIALEVEVGPGATLVLFTQASTKVFRGRSSQSLRARVDGTLVVLPDPVAAFATARYTQRVDVELGRAGACVLLDGFTSGRAAFGERWAMGCLDLRTTVTHEGRPVVTDALRLDAADGALAERVGRYEAFSTLLAVGSGAKPVADAIAGEPVAPPDPDLVVAASPLPRTADLGLPGAALRVAATSPARALEVVRRRLRNLPDIGAVDPYIARH
jgi:urease accessory protein